MKPLQSRDRLRGRRIVLSVDEPTVFAQMDDDQWSGSIERILTLRNEAGEPYEVAFVRLDRPLSYGVHSSTVVSLMTRYAKNELADLLSSEMLIVNITLDEPWVLDAESSDPRFADRSRNFYLGYGTVSLADHLSKPRDRPEGEDMRDHVQPDWKVD